MSDPATLKIDRWWNATANLPQGHTHTHIHIIIETAATLGGEEGRRIKRKGQTWAWEWRMEHHRVREGRKRTGILQHHPSPLSLLFSLSHLHTHAGWVEGNAWCLMKGQLRMGIVILCCEADKEKEWETNEMGRGCMACLSCTWIHFHCVTCLIVIISLTEIKNWSSKCGKSWLFCWIKMEPQCLHCAGVDAECLFPLGAFPFVTHWLPNKSSTTRSGFSTLFFLLFVSFPHRRH